MENCNRNSNSSPWYFFVLFPFLIGLILYIFLKQSSNKKTVLKSNEDKVFDKIPRVFKKVNNDANRNKEMLTSRQKMILDTLKKNDVVYPSDLKKLLPNVSTRTIRRDMTVLVDIGYASQLGSTKSTYYKYTA